MNKQVISGHGDLAAKADLLEYYNMLVETSRTVRLQINAGRSLGEILDTGLNSTWDSWTGGFINEERWIQTLYESFSEG